MNSRYFGCRTCETYIDAGYRWCYWTLEVPGIIERGQRVSADQVLAAQEYWSIPQEEEARWLRELLPKVREFGEPDDIAINEDDFWLIWLNSDLTDKVQQQCFLTTRYMVQVLKLREWKQVEDYISTIAVENRPYWIDYPEYGLAKVRSSFEQLLHSQPDPASRK